LEVDPGFRPDHALAMEVERPALPVAQYNQLSEDQQIAYGGSRQFSLRNSVRRSARCPASRKSAGSPNCRWGRSCVTPRDSSLRGSRLRTVEGAHRGVSHREPGLFLFDGNPVARGAFFQRRRSQTAKYGDQRNDGAAVLPAWRRARKRINLCSLDPKPCWNTIVGVAGNVHQYGLDHAPTYDVYFVGGWTRYLIVRTASDPLSLAAAVTEVVHRFDPNLPVTQVMTMDNLISDSVSPRRFSSVLVAIFAGLALVLAAVGFMA